MRRMLTARAALVALLAVATGCQALMGKRAGTSADDAAITASVKARLVADTTSNFGSVNVDTNNGTVYLTGVVGSVEQKTRAEQLVWATQGVRGVVNDLRVSR